MFFRFKIRFLAQGSHTRIGSCSSVCVCDVQHTRIHTWESGVMRSGFGVGYDGVTRFIDDVSGDLEPNLGIDQGRKKRCVGSCAGRSWIG